MPDILEKAADLTSGDRNKEYGSPLDDFDRVSRMTAPIMESSIDPRLKHALYMVQVKISRLLNSPEHKDSLIDAAGYINTYAMVLEEMQEGGA